MSGVRKACQGRPVTEGDLAVLAQKVEESVRQTGSSQVDTNEIGLAILGPLRELDEVAYLRFASVYQAFDSLEDFESAIGAAARRPRRDRDRDARHRGRDRDREARARADSLGEMYPLLFRTVLSRMDPETAHHAAMVVIRLLGIPPFSWAARALTRPAPAAATDGARAELRVAVRRRGGLRQGRPRGRGPRTRSASGTSRWARSRRSRRTATRGRGCSGSSPTAPSINRMGFNNRGAEAAAPPAREAAPPLARAP